MSLGQYYVYFMSGWSNRVIYTGMTGNIIQRVYQHKNKTNIGFSKKYNLNKLVYYEVFNDKETAMRREKQLKGGNRKKKEDLINTMNPKREDLYEKIRGNIR